MEKKFLGESNLPRVNVKFKNFAVEEKKLYLLFMQILILVIKLRALVTTPKAQQIMGNYANYKACKMHQKT